MCRTVKNSLWNGDFWHVRCRSCHQFLAKPLSPVSSFGRDGSNTVVVAVSRRDPRTDLRPKIGDNDSSACAPPLSRFDFADLDFLPSRWVISPSSLQTDKCKAETFPVMSGVSAVATSCPAFCVSCVNRSSRCAGARAYIEWNVEKPPRRPRILGEGCAGRGPPSTPVPFEPCMIATRT